MTNKIFELVKRIQSITETGLQYSPNEFDMERYKEIHSISLRLLEFLTDQPYEKIKLYIEENNGYKTPKIDVRAAVFNEDNQILMVKERKDESWSLPGGFADTGYTPSEIAVKETKEEAGINIVAKKLVAVFDKRTHSHPLGLFDAYKLFFLCEQTGGVLSSGMETLDARYFSKENLPDLSTPRNTKYQINIMFDFHEGKRHEVVFD